MKIAVYTHNFAHLIGTVAHTGDGVLRLRPAHKGMSVGISQVVDRHYRDGETPDEFLKSLPERVGFWAETLGDNEEPQPGFNDGPADRLPGGLADGKTDADFPAGAVDKGARVEREHTKERALAREIARDHLVEDEDYYKKLGKAGLSLAGRRVLGRTPSK